MKFASRLCLGILLSCALLCCTGAFAQTTGAIRGTVKDPSGASVPNAKVTATNEGTQVARTASTDKDGDFTIAELAVGQYTVTVEASGFKKFVTKGLSVDIGHVATVQAQLVLGGSEQTVTVEAEAAQVETTSTQLGAVMNDRAVTELPLNTRDTYQLLQLQPGVQSQLGSNLFAGSGDPGVVTVNGGRGRANNYMVNGGNANDVFINLPAVQPSPDAIQEFRILTNTFDAEFGRNSGAVVNVVTKSGTNHVHGDVFEYVRNTALDAGNFFDNASGLPTAVFKQNQFGGTLGGPIKQDKTFIFGSYEGRRNRQGISSGSVTLPTGQVPTATTLATGELGGDFSGTGAVQCNQVSGVKTNVSQFCGTLVDSFFAGILAGRSGGACNSDTTAEETTKSFMGYTGGIAAGVPYAEIFPNEKIPPSCFDPTAVSLLNNLPLSGANPATGIVDTAPIQRIRGDQFSTRFDHKLTAAQQLSVYYYFDDSSTFQPFSFFQAAGANVPGFGDNNTARFQQWNLSHTWTIGSSAVNEFRFTYFREGQKLNDHPVNVSSDGTAHTLCQVPGPFPTVPAANCFQQSGSFFNGVPVPQSAGITTTLPGHAGVPDITVNGGFTMGNNFEGELPQIGNVFEWSDNYSKVMGKHNLKFGGDLSRDRFDQTLFFETTGLITTLSVQDLCAVPSNPVINPDTTNCTPVIFGNDDVGFADSYPDYLLGFVNTYNQGGTQGENLRNTMVSFFGQDSWKIRPSLTLNYGLRWELDTPYGDKGHRLQTFRPGQADTVFNCQISSTYPSGIVNPSAGLFGGPGTDCSPTGSANAVFPLGIVFPGDKGVPEGVTQTYYKSFAPRIGLAWSPGWSDGFLGKLFGGPGKSSVRMGWGVFYNPIEQLVLEQFSAEPPYGGSNTLFSTLFNTPFEFASGGFAGDGSIPAPNPFGSRLNPPRGSNVDWSQFRPIVMFGEFQPHLRAQYSEQYNLTIQRELAKDMIFQIGYVGTQGHRLLLSHDLNAGNPQTCLDLIAVQGTFNGCGPFGADFVYFSIPAGTPAPSPNFVFHLPYTTGPVAGGPNVPCPFSNPPPSCLVPFSNTTGSPTAINISGTRPFSSPFCEPIGPSSGTGCPPDVPVFSSIFVQDTVGNSNYNSLQAMLEKHFSGGLQFQAAYTFSKSIDNASSFENIVNPFNSRLSRSLSLFDARHRFVFSPVWELPIPKRTGFAGKVVNGWQVSGILTYQTGFPIRIQSGDDTELTTSDGDFEVVGQPQITGKVQFLNPHNTPTITCSNGTTRPAGNYQFNPCSFADSALGTFGNSPRALCCGPGISQTDISIAKKTAISEKVNTEFVAQFFNTFNHTQFLTPDGNFSHTATFGTVTSARDPRVLQFGLKFLF
ncbi:MAG TPA: carboxypeptidase regulatory-like domain-containing protein [Candidatus Acidoferrales bacterium]|nr:carboxypeptidase regulatory-like domain-containing protein [Candidatus Acidoferrales bacterium]